MGGEQMSEGANYVDCARFEEILHDLDRPGTLDPRLVDGALAHAESCSHCGQLLTEAESLDFGLQTLAARESNLQAGPRVEAFLLRKFRTRQAASARHSFQWRLAALGTAAMLVLAMGLVLHQRLTTRRNVVGVEQPSHAAPNVTAPSPSQQPATAASASDTTEYAAGFVSLPYADDPSTLDDASIVRVVLSRPALASLGVTVPDTSDTEAVPADLILSEDGTPEAIRLVSQTTAGQSF
jgi:hypothetical protein